MLERLFLPGEFLHFIVHVVEVVFSSWIREFGGVNLRICERSSPVFSLSARKWNVIFTSRSEKSDNQADACFAFTIVETSKN